MKTKTHIQEIKSINFEQEHLKISLNDSICYRVATQKISDYSSLYGTKSRFFILYIEEINRESPPLFTHDTFEYKFIEPGIYSVSCLNYPKMRQTVVVDHEREFPREQSSYADDNLSDMSQLESEASSCVNNQDILFMQSEDGSNLKFQKDLNHTSVDNLSNFNSVKDLKCSNLKNIGNCLKLISEGIPVENIVDKYPELFDNQSEFECTKNDTKDDLLIENDANSMFDQDAFNKIKEIGKGQKSQRDFEKIYEVYKINKQNPDNLFKIFTRLKNDFEGQNDADLEEDVYKSIEDAHTKIFSGVDLDKIKPGFPQGHRSRKLRRALAVLEKRFKEK